MRDPQRITHQQVSEAGENYVLYRLYLMGLVGGQAPRGMPETDLLVMDRDGNALATVQVKARLEKPRDGGWHMQKKHEQIVTPRLFYVFVGFETEPPLSYVIPSAIVADAVRDVHLAWLRAPGKNGKQHNDSSFRRLVGSPGLDIPEFPDGWIEKYRDGWEMLPGPPLDRSRVRATSSSTATGGSVESDGDHPDVQTTPLTALTPQHREAQGFEAIGHRSCGAVPPMYFSAPAVPLDSLTARARCRPAGRSD